MQGRVENAILDFANKHEPAIQVTITKPGGIAGPTLQKNAVAMGLYSLFGWVPVSVYAAAIIDQCENGITKDLLWSKDLSEIGSHVLSREGHVGYNDLLNIWFFAW